MVSQPEHVTFSYWRGDVIKASARAEIESSKEEKDPEVLARALVNARMAFDEIQEKVNFVCIHTNVVVLSKTKRVGETRRRVFEKCREITSEIQIWGARFIWRVV